MLRMGLNALISMKFVLAENNYIQFVNNDSHIRDGKMRELRG
jgi:hypothetical protein